MGPCGRCSLAGSAASAHYLLFKYSALNKVSGHGACSWLSPAHSWRRCWANGAVITGCLFSHESNVC